MIDNNDKVGYHLSMTQAQTDVFVAQEELAMGNVISHVPKLLKERGWGPMDLVRKAEIGVRTAYRLADGDVDFTIQTLAKLCELFELPVEDIIVFSPSDDEEQPG